MAAPRDAMQRPAGAPSLPEKVVAIHHALDAARIPHALGGALALAYYGEPRATVDVDLNVFVPTERWEEIRRALEPLGIDVEIDEGTLTRDGQVRLWWDRNPVDLFFSYDPFHEEMKRSSRRAPFSETTIPVLSPEHLAVCKAMFNRPKDWLDIEQILVATSPLDVEEIDAWLRRMVGDEDERLRKLHDLRQQLAA
jgi:Nucleotidyl transferase AbiEii toxin, Type IV TA system